MPVAWTMSWRGHLAVFDQQLSALDPVVVFEQATLGRTRSARAILVIRTAMAGTHEQTGLREPANRTPEVRAINRKHLKRLPVHIANPTSDICRNPIPRIHNWIAISGQACLARRELFDAAENDPG